MQEKTDTDWHDLAVSFLDILQCVLSKLFVLILNLLIKSYSIKQVYILIHLFHKLENFFLKSGSANNISVKFRLTNANNVTCMQHDELGNMGLLHIKMKCLTSSGSFGFY